MVMDMIGDADLDILRDTNGTPWLLDLIYAAAERGGYQSHFYALRRSASKTITFPSSNAASPAPTSSTCHYGYNDVFHHTPQDTMDKLSPKSLEIVGDTILETIHLLDQR